MIYDYKTDTLYSSHNPFSSKTGVPAAVWLSVLQPLRHGGWNLLHSEVIGRQASVVDVENQAGIVSGGIEHLQQVDKRKRW